MDQPTKQNTAEQLRVTCLSQGHIHGSLVVVGFKLTILLLAAQRLRLHFPMFKADPAILAICLIWEFLWDTNQLQQSITIRKSLEAKINIILSACRFAPEQMKSVWEPNACGLHDGAQAIVKILLIFMDVTRSAK